MFNITIMRASCARTAQMRSECGICSSEFELGAVFAWINTDAGPDEICERCLQGLCEWACSEGLDVPWKDTYAAYLDARRRYPEPMATEEELAAMSYEEEGRLLEEAYLTPWRN